MFSVLKEETLGSGSRREQINLRQIAEEHGERYACPGCLDQASFGLVTIRPRVGFFAGVHPTEVREIFEVRRLHEMYCMGATSTKSTSLNWSR